LPEANLSFHFHARTALAGARKLRGFHRYRCPQRGGHRAQPIEPALHGGPEVRALPGDELVCMEAGPHRFRRGRQMADGDLRRLGRASWRLSRPVELIAPVSCRQNGHLDPGTAEVTSGHGLLTSPPLRNPKAREPLLTGKERDSER
jgi:hypothetical protein